MIVTFDNSIFYLFLFQVTNATLFLGTVCKCLEAGDNVNVRSSLIEKDGNMDNLTMTKDNFAASQMAESKISSIATSVSFSNSF